jgi:hypothetical protein
MEREDRSVAEQIAKAMPRKALRGEVAAAKELADRTEGKPIQQGSGSQPAE